MKFHKFQLIYYFRIALILVISILLIWYLASWGRRNRKTSYFDTRCIDYEQKNYNRRLNDKIVDYSAAAKLRGIQPCKDDKELKKRISEGKLVKIKTGSGYIVDKMTYSYPCVTESTEALIDEISKRFREKVSQKGLKGARFIITSMTRKTESIKSLRKNNQNASANSPHLYGNAFDITYRRFVVRKWLLTSCDKRFLKDALGEVIWQLKLENRCWATYETGQSCFHVVAR